MAIIARGFRSTDPNLPLANINPADLAINRRSSLRARLKGRAGHIFDAGATRHWVDYCNGARYPVTGGVTSAPDSGFNGRGVATFAAGGRVDLGHIMPVDADFTQIVVFRRMAGETMVLLGDDDDASWNSLHTLGGSGRIAITQGGSGYTDDNDLAIGTPHIVARTWNHATKTARVFANGAQVAEAALVNGVSNSRLYVGHLAFVPVPFAGQIAEVLVFAEDLQGTVLDDILSHLRSDYGV